MTMSSNTTMVDEVGPLVDDSIPPNPPGPAEQVITAIKNLILPTNRELLALMKMQTPLKVSKLLTTTAAGTLGGSVAFPDLSQIIYTAPVSAEAWLNRIMLSSPDRGPGNPITGTGPTNVTTNIGNPGAGNPFNSPASLNGTLLSVAFTVTTSATVANRLIGIQVNGVNYFASVAQTASTVMTYTFAPGLNSTTVLPATPGFISVGIPAGLVIPANSAGAISEATQGYQVGDTTTAISFVTSTTPTSGQPQIVLIGSTFGEVILALPETGPSAGAAGQVIPAQFVEGAMSAPHLDRGESISISGDGLPATTRIRIDMQIMILTGASEFTPKRLSPMDLTAKDSMQPD